MSTDLSEVSCRARNIVTIKPDYVILGKCAACHQFFRKYYSVNSDDVVLILNSGFKYDGFKNATIESNEEQGFANMHHVLLISSLDASVSREVCVQRINNIKIDVEQLKNENKVVSDIHSVVIFMYNREKVLDLFYFGKYDHSYFKVDYPAHDFTANLVLNVLYLTFETYLLVINFNREIPITKHVNFSSDIKVLAMSSEMVVTYKNSDDVPILYCNELDASCRVEIVTSKETLATLTNGQVAIVSVYGKTIWLSANDKEIFVYSYSRDKELYLLDVFHLNILFPRGVELKFVSFICSFMQAFLLYTKDSETDKNSVILVLDLKTLKVLSILHMELTLNRMPQLEMYPSGDGSKLFVQEKFENRVIFYQVFSLLRVNFLLKNIAQCFIWRTFTKDCIVNLNIPQFLKDEILQGY